MSDNDDALLRILEAHGQQFLNSFDPSVVSRKRKSLECNVSGNRKRRRVENEELDASTEEEEWAGFSDGSSVNTDDEDNDVIYGSETDHPSRTSSEPNVVVFSETKLGLSTSNSIRIKAQQKAFMSSKVSKLTTDAASHHIVGEEPDSDEGDDLTNAQNDALLHRLVHTKILSGSLNPDLNVTPAERRKALAGRVLEAAGQAKLGRGESVVRVKERNSNAKRVRDGLLAKQKERSQKELEEAKNMGNYHPALKQLFDDGTSSKPKGKRERGLKMGVGSFSRGVLRLRKREVASVTGQTRAQSRKGVRRK